MVNLNGVFLSLCRSWWIVVTVSGMAGLLTYHVVRQMPPTYVATTSLLVGDVLRSPRPGDGEFSITQNLANGYAQIAVRQPVLERVARALNLPWRWEDLRKRIVVVHPTGSLVIEIRAMDFDPIRAKDIASTLADQLIASSPTASRRQELEPRQQFVRDEMNAFQAKINQGQIDLAKKQADLAKESTARGVLDRQDEIKAIELNLTNWRKAYSDLLTSVEGRADPNSLTIIEPATVPAEPTGPRAVWFVLLATVGGFLVSSAGVIGTEHLTGTIRSRHDLRGMLREGMGGFISYIPRFKSRTTSIAVLAEPDSLAAESYRLLAAQLRYGVLGTGPHVLMVTSPTNGEGKSTTAANLAAALALGGAETLLMDLDLRKPGLHHIFGVPNRGGASALLRENDSNVDHYAVQTALPRLRLLPAGLPIGNPTELLSRSSAPLLLGAANSADFVIVDGPPLLAVADAVVLSGHVSDMLFVTRYEQTSDRNLRQAIDVLDGLPTQVRVIVLNAAPDDQLTLSGYRPSGKRPRIGGGWRPFGLRRGGKPAALAERPVSAPVGDL